MYALFARVQALDAMRVAFKEHIKKTGLALVLDEEKVQTPSPLPCRLYAQGCHGRESHDMLRCMCPAYHRSDQHSRVFFALAVACCSHLRCRLLI